MTDSHISPTDNAKSYGPIPYGIEATMVDEGLMGKTELQNRFGFHKATIEGAEATKPKHAMLREAWLEFAEWLDSELPAGREKDETLTHMENASMWSHKAIANTAPLAED